MKSMELLITDLLNWKNYSYSLLKMELLLITDLLNYVKLEKYSLPKNCHYPQLVDSYSLLRSLRKAQLYSRILATSEVVWDRIGIPSFLVYFEPGALSRALSGREHSLAFGRTEPAVWINFQLFS